MKASAIILLLSLPAWAGEMRDIASRDQLSHQLRISQQHDPMRNLEVVEGADPSEAARPEDLLATSEILSFNGIATLVPKGAVLAAPANLRGRMSYQAGARMVPWQEFLVLNRGWIRTAELSFEQAAGRAEWPEALRKQLEESRMVVIATMRQGPISVNPHRPAEDEGSTAAPVAAE